MQTFNVVFSFTDKDAAFAFLTNLENQDYDGIVVDGYGSEVSEEDED